MSPWVWAPWLPWALLLIHVPGCLSLRSPRYLDGTIGGSLSMRYTYEQEDKNNSKFWCEFPCKKSLQLIVMTSETQQEERRGRVTIRDEPANLTFTVTLENLTEDDSGLYLCGVLRPKHSKDLIVPMVVFVSSAFTTAPHAASITPGPQLEPAEPTRKQPPDLHSNNDSGASGRGSIHFRLLIFLKMPLLLGMIGAVLWVSRSQRGPRLADSTV